VAFLSRTQGAQPLADGAGAGGPLLIERAEMLPARTKADEAMLEVVFVVARIAAEAPAQD
jgi:hypothetical protein